MGLYDRYLGLRLRRHHADPPTHIALVITERDILEQGAYETLEQFCTWALSYGASQVTIAVSVLDQAVIPTLKRELRNIETPKRLTVRGPDDTEPVEAPIRISIGMGGKQEFADAVRELATDVKAGKLSPQDIDEEAISNRLVFADEPDLLIKTGAERLSDFAIWQSVYSELYFCDVNWHDFRKRDLLRAILDFQDRQRRFGE
jgi:undecaprenyl diphosphate synthase